jgi:hypothetical protein
MEFVGDNCVFLRGALMEFYLLRQLKKTPNFNSNLNFLNRIFCLVSQNC